MNSPAGPPATEVSAGGLGSANLNALRSFVAVVDCGSVSAAAQARGYSPAAVSRQIGWLQRRLGVQLFVPAGRSIRPTASALELAEQGRKLTAAAERFDTYAASLTGRLHQGPPAVDAIPR